MALLPTRTSSGEGVELLAITFCLSVIASMAGSLLAGLVVWAVRRIGSR